jgi:hypothetical protein
MPKPLDEQTLTGNILHQWTIQEYEQHKRGVLWYVLVISFGMFFVIFGFVTNNFLFALIIILSAIILFIQSKQSSPQVDILIAELGIIVGQRFYPYSELKSFFIIYQPPEVKTLFIDTKNSIRPMLRIPILDQNPVDIRNDLLDFLDEDLEQENEPISDTFARRWKIN